MTPRNYLFLIRSDLRWATYFLLRGDLRRADWYDRSALEWTRRLVRELLDMTANSL